MGLYGLRGRLSRLGQFEFDNETVVYAFIEIIDAEGRRALVKRVAVFSDVASGIHEGMEGDFYFDELFVFGRKVKCQLWGFTTAERRIMDSVNFRHRVTRGNLIFGILFTPVLALGSTHLVAGLCQIVVLLSGTANRSRFLSRFDVNFKIAPPLQPSEQPADLPRSASAKSLGERVHPHDDMMRL